MNERDDLRLLQAVARREESALSALYDGHGERLFSLAVRILGRPSAAEDVLAEVFAVVWRGSEPHDAARGSVATWLRTLTRQLALAHRRPEGMAPGQVAARLTEAPDAATDPLLSSFCLVWSALPAAERAAISLSYFDGLSVGDMARCLGQSPDAVRAALLRGMRTLRDGCRIAAAAAPEAQNAGPHATAPPPTVARQTTAATPNGR